MNVISIRIGKIKVGERVRKDLGELDDLAQSMESLGLLHPVVLNSRHELIAGLRRLRAAESLGWEFIDASVCETLDDLVKALNAEDDENTCRKDFTPKEGVAMGKKIEAMLKPEAEANSASNLRVGNLPTRETSGNSIVGRIKEAAAKSAGMSRRTYEKAEEVIDSGEVDIAEEMNESANIHAAHKKLKARQQAKQVDSNHSAALQQYANSVRKFASQIDHVQHDAEKLSAHPLAKKMGWQSIIDLLKTARRSVGVGLRRLDKDD